MVLRLPQRSELWLFDCGEGTQHQILRSDLRLSQIKKIFISHMHGDHVFGLPGLLASLGLAGNSSGIDIYGPKQLENYIYGAMNSTSSGVSYPISFHDVKIAAEQDEDLIKDKDFQVKATPLIHRVPSYAYRVDQKPRPGRFNIEKAKSLKISPGPIYAALKRGERIRLEDGRILNGKDFCAPPLPGTSMVYCTDTVFSENAIDISRGADLLIHESTYSHADSELAFQRKHSTSTMAAQVASEASARQLVLTHLSPRYVPGQGISPEDILKEAKAIFPNTLLARDYLRLDIKPRCNSS